MNTRFEKIFRQNRLEMNEKKIILFWTVLQFLNMNKLGFVEFWKIIPVFAQRKELILNSRNLEVSKEQCTSYCIFRSSREGYWRMKKNFDFSGQLIQFLNTSRLCFVKFWKVVPVFTHGKRVVIQLLNL